MKAAILRQYRVGLIAVGLIAGIGGIRGMSTGEVLGGRYGVQSRERFTGVSARRIGAVLLLAGLLVIVLSAIDLYTLGGVRDWLSALAGVNTDMESPQIIGLDCPLFIARNVRSGLGAGRG